MLISEKWKVSAKTLPINGLYPCQGWVRMDDWLTNMTGLERLVDEFKGPSVIEIGVKPIMR